MCLWTQWLGIAVVWMNGKIVDEGMRVILVDCFCLGWVSDRDFFGCSGHPILLLTVASRGGFENSAALPAWGEQAVGHEKIPTTDDEGPS